MEFIKWLQARLNLHGASIEVDGDWGRKSIAALRIFQRGVGLTQSGVADKETVAALKLNLDHAPNSVATPSETMPPWMTEMYRRMGLNEIRDNAAVIAFLKIGRYLGNPKDLPWCGDAVESCMSKTLPTESLPSNPFFAQNWAKFGKDVKVPLVGSIGVIKWSASSGHVGFVAGMDGDKVNLLAGNQSNSINISSFARSKFIAFRWPTTFPVKGYPALKGKATAVTTENSTR